MTQAWTVKAADYEDEAHAQQEHAPKTIFASFKDALVAVCEEQGAGNRNSLGGIGRLHQPDIVAVLKGFVPL